MASDQPRHPETQQFQAHPTADPGGGQVFTPKQLRNIGVAGLTGDLPGPAVAETDPVYAADVAAAIAGGGAS